MRRVSAWLLLAIAFGVDALAQNPAQAPNPDTFYRLGPDSLEQEGVPKGEIRGSFTLPSTVFPGTQNVLDNLIYRWEIPVMIGVFINPGRRPDQPEPTPQNWGDRDTSRPTEYNALDDRYPRVIVDELLPILYKEYNISKADHPVSTDPRDEGERSFRGPAARN